MVSNLIRQIIFLMYFLYVSKALDINSISPPHWEVNIITSILQIRKPRLRIVAQSGRAGIWIWNHRDPKPGPFPLLSYHIPITESQITGRCFINVCDQCVTCLLLISLRTCSQQPMFLRYRPHKSTFFFFTTELPDRIQKIQIKVIITD